MSLMVGKSAEKPPVVEPVVCALCAARPARARCVGCDRRVCEFCVACWSLVICIECYRGHPWPPGRPHPPYWPHPWPPGRPPIFEGE